MSNTFKEGDLVRATLSPSGVERYAYTTSRAVCRVLETDGRRIRIQIIKNATGRNIGDCFTEAAENFEYAEFPVLSNE